MGQQDQSDPKQAQLLSGMPKHVAIIMDGNGRWAVNRGLPRIFGHHQGAVAVRRVVEAGVDVGLEALTLYAFSWENWSRPTAEIRDLMGLLVAFLRGELASMRRRHIRLRAIGRLDALPKEARCTLQECLDQTSAHTGMTLTLALSYGGRQEIVDAVRRISVRVQEGQIRPDEIDEALFSEHLWTAGLPDPDLLIRTSGEQRLSNFLLWQTSYTELYITPTLWPDFSKEHLLDAMTEFSNRDRRFGKADGPEATPRFTATGSGVAKLNIADA